MPYKDPEKQKAAQAAWYAAHREAIRVSSREYRESHREERFALKRAYYAAHRDKLNAQKRAYRESHRDPTRVRRYSTHAVKAKLKAKVNLSRKVATAPGTLLEWRRWIRRLAKNQFPSGTERVRWPS